MMPQIADGLKKSFSGMYAPVLNKIGPYAPIALYVLIGTVFTVILAMFIHRLLFDRWNYGR